LTDSPFMFMLIMRGGASLLCGEGRGFFCQKKGSRPSLFLQSILPY